MSIQHLCDAINQITVAARILNTSIFEERASPEADKPIWQAVTDSNLIQLTALSAKLKADLYRLKEAHHDA